MTRKASVRQSVTGASISLAQATAPADESAGAQSRAPGNENIGYTHIFHRQFEYLKHMRFTQDSSAGINLIRAYGNGELRVNENVYRGASS